MPWSSQGSREQEAGDRQGRCTCLLSGDYFIGDTAIEATQKAQAKYPDKIFFLGRSGYDFAIGQFIALDVVKVHRQLVYMLFRQAYMSTESGVDDCRDDHYRPALLEANFHNGFQGLVDRIRAVASLGVYEL